MRRRKDPRAPSCLARIAEEQLGNQGDYVRAGGSTTSTSFFYNKSVESRDAVGDGGYNGPPVGLFEGESAHSAAPVRGRRLTIGGLMKVGGTIAASICASQRSLRLHDGGDKHKVGNARLRLVTSFASSTSNQSMDVGVGEKMDEGASL